jgi:hypothetical protein
MQSIGQAKDMSFGETGEVMQLHENKGSSWESVVVVVGV